MDKVLEKYVRFIRALCGKELLVILDTKLNIIFISPECLKLTKISSRKEVLGRNIFEVTDVPQCNKIIAHSEFSAAIDSNKRKQFFSTNLYRASPHYSLLINFQPITNPRAENQIMCALVEFVPVELSYFYDLLLNNEVLVEGPNLPDNDKFLTRREHQIAFLLFHSKNLIEIANLIGKFEGKSITASTVNNIIHRYLFKKFMVKNKEDLMDKLIENGYHKKMPNSLLSNIFVDITNYD